MRKIILMLSLVGILSPLNASPELLKILQVARVENQQAAIKSQELYQVLEQDPDLFQTMDVVLQALIYTLSRLNPEPMQTTNLE